MSHSFSRLQLLRYFKFRHLVDPGNNSGGTLGLEAYFRGLLDRALGRILAPAPRSGALSEDVVWLMDDAFVNPALLFRSASISAPARAPLCPRFGFVCFGLCRLDLRLQFLPLAVRLPVTCSSDILARAVSALACASAICAFKLPWMIRISMRFCSIFNLRTCVSLPLASAILMDASSSDLRSSKPVQ